MSPHTPTFFRSPQKLNEPPQSSFPQTTATAAICSRTMHHEDTDGSNLNRLALNDAAAADAAR